MSTLLDTFCAVDYRIDMTAPATAADRAPPRNKDQVRECLLDAFIGLLIEGSSDLSHDAVAERAGVARRTAYRYFPDRGALMDAALLRVRELAGVRVAYPENIDDLIDTLEPIYTGFDSIAPIATMLRSTPQGRQLRMAQNDQRIASYTRALAPAVENLPPHDRKLATAMLQVLHTTPWLEMRDHWGLTGSEIARTTRWAIRALLKDLRERGGLSLDEELKDENAA